jgi:N-acylglucosamine-6-phosphate 2-epimerase
MTLTCDEFIAAVRGKLIVSCQALEDEPLYGAEIMAKMAVAAQMGGAVAIRANTPVDIRAIRAAVDLPIIGLYKSGTADVYITPTIQHALEIVEAGADVVAIDGTQRPRPNGDSFREQVAGVHAQGRLVLADVSTLAEGISAAEQGADFIAPTLSGYTTYSRQLAEPDFVLLRELVETVQVPVIAEGRIHTPQQARQALDYGALAVVVGSAITRPQLITATFVKAIT